MPASGAYRGCARRRDAPQPTQTRRRDVQRRLYPPRDPQWPRRPTSTGLMIPPGGHADGLRAVTAELGQVLTLFRPVEITGGPDPADPCATRVLLDTSSSC